MLVVEDDPQIREIVSDLLETEGYKVVQAACVEDALDVMANVIPDRVLLDLMMKRLDGRHLLATIKSDPTFQHIPVVIMTAARQYQCPGAKEVLEKPFSIDQLLKALED